MIITEMELFYYFIACLAFSLEFADTVEFVKTRDSYIPFI